MTNNTFFAASALSLLLFSAPSARAEQPRTVEPPRLTILLYNYAQAPEGLLSAAARVGGHIFDRAGIDTVWAICSMSADQSTHASCSQPAGKSVVYVKLLDREMASKLAGATGADVFGFALPDEGGFGQNVTIFQHRVAELAERSQPYGNVVMGRILVHEIGHLLLGFGGHERRGIMSPTWSKTELLDASLAGLNFSKTKAQRMRKQVLARMEHDRKQQAPAQLVATNPKQ